MKSPKKVIDPLQNDVLLSYQLDNNNYQAKELFESLKKVITRPAFIIQINHEKLYYLRLIDWDTNILVEAKARDGIFVACDYMENPDTKLIEKLLKKGRLICFAI